MIYYILTLACILNAAMDSIDHNKRSLGLFALWHTVKNLFIAILIVPWMLLAGVQWYMFIVVAICWRLLWEVSYWFFNSIRIYELDDKWECSWIRLIYGFSRPK